MNLKKVNRDIESGMKFKAADRLRNLINLEPDNMELWDKLAELYYEAGFLDAAGKYWILNDSNQPHIKECVDLYETSVSYSGSQILKEITYRGNRENLSSFARSKLESLENNSIEITHNVPVFSKWNNKEPLSNYSENGRIGCILVVLVILILLSIFIIGIIQIYKWISIIE